MAFSMQSSDVNFGLCSGSLWGEVFHPGFSGQVCSKCSWSAWSLSLRQENAHNLFCFFLRLRPGCPWNDAGCVPGTDPAYPRNNPVCPWDKPRFSPITHSGSPVGPRDKPSLSLLQLGVEAQQKSVCLYIYIWHICIYIYITSLCAFFVANRARVQSIMES